MPSSRRFRLAILALMETAPWGGSEELWASVAAESLARGHEVAVSVRDWGRRPERLERLAQQRLKILPRRARPPRTLPRRIAWRLRRQLPTPFEDIRSFQPDLVLVSQGGAYCAWSQPELERLLREWNAAYWMISHSADDRIELPEDTRQRFRRLFAGAKGVGFPAEATRQLVERQVAMRFERGFVFRNPVNLTDFSPLPWPASEEATFAFVGRITALKGVDALLEALGQPAWRERRWRLRLFGTADNPQWFHELVSFFGLGERVEFCGQTHDLRSVWAANQCFVLPSRMESAPLSLVEAMLCGRPSVATAVGGIPEWITPGESGFLSRGVTAGEFAEALETAWQAHDRWPAIGARARQDAGSRVDAQAGRTLLNRLLAGVPTGPAAA